MVVAACKLSGNVGRLRGRCLDLELCRPGHTEPAVASQFPITTALQASRTFVIHESGSWKWL